MGRIRFIKPDFFTDDDLATLPVLDRLTFIGLWCVADKAGRIEDKPKRLRALIYPYEPDVDMSSILDRLTQIECLVRYTVGGRKFIYIKNFQKHQRPHRREADSILPAPPETTDDGPRTVLAAKRTVEAAKRTVLGRSKDRPSTVLGSGSTDSGFWGTDTDSGFVSTDSGKVTHQGPSTDAPRPVPDPVQASTRAEKGPGRPLDAPSRPSPDEIDLGWAEAQRAATGVLGRRPGHDQWPYLIELCERYSSAEEIWLRATLMWQSPEYGRLTCNPKLLAKIAPQLDRHVAQHGADVPYGSTTPETADPNQVLRDKWGIA